MKYNMLNTITFYTEIQFLNKHNINIANKMCALDKK